MATPTPAVISSAILGTADRHSLSLAANASNDRMAVWIIDSGTSRQVAYAYYNGTWGAETAAATGAIGSLGVVAGGSNYLVWWLDNDTLNAAVYTPGAGFGATTLLNTSSAGNFAFVGDGSGGYGAIFRDAGSGVRLGLRTYSAGAWSATTYDTQVGADTFYSITSLHIASAGTDDYAASFRYTVTYLGNGYLGAVAHPGAGTWGTPYFVDDTGTPSDIESVITAAPTAGAYALAWRRGPNLDPAIAVVGTGGATILSYALDAETNSANNLALASDGTDFLLAWEQVPAADTSGVYVIKVTTAGTPTLAGAAERINGTGTTGTTPQVASDGSSFAIAYLQSGAVYRVHGDFGAWGTPTALSDVAANLRSNLSFKSSGDGYMAVWREGSTSHSIGLGVYTNIVGIYGWSSTPAVFTGSGNTAGVAITPSPQIAVTTTGWDGYGIYWREGLYPIGGGNLAAGRLDNLYAVNTLPTMTSGTVPTPSATALTTPADFGASVADSQVLVNNAGQQVALITYYDYAGLKGPTYVSLDDGTGSGWSAPTLLIADGDVQAAVAGADIMLTYAVTTAYAPARRYDLRARRVTGAGAAWALGSETVLSNTVLQSVPWKLATDGSGFAVAWKETDDAGTTFTVWGNVFSSGAWGSATNLAGSPVTATSNVHGLESAGAGEYMVLWSSASTAVQASRYTSSAWQAVALLTNAADTVGRAALFADPAGTGYLAVWEDLVGGFDPKVNADVYSGSWGGTVQIQAQSVYANFADFMAMPVGGGNWALAWAAAAFGDFDTVLMRVYDAGGTAWSSTPGADGLVFSSASTITPLLDLVQDATTGAAVLVYAQPGVGGGYDLLTRSVAAGGTQWSAAETLLSATGWPANLALAASGSTVTAVVSGPEVDLGATTLVRALMRDDLGTWGAPQTLMSEGATAAVAEVQGYGSGNYAVMWVQGDNAFTTGQGKHFLHLYTGGAWGTLYDLGNLDPHGVAEMATELGIYGGAPDTTDSYRTDPVLAAVPK